MSQAVTLQRIELENETFRGTGGVSAESSAYGFKPAFRDGETGRVYLSCFADGRPAPFHLLDGLPGEVVVRRDMSGRVVDVKAGMVSGFTHQGRFYTREEAARQVSGGGRMAAVEEATGLAA